MDVSPIILTCLVLALLAPTASLPLVSSEGENHAVPGGATTSVCEYYNATCLSAAKDPGAASQCYGDQICLTGSVNSGYNCYAVWTNEEADEGLGPHAHSSGLSVKMMGCYTSSDEECMTEGECVERDSKLNLSMNHLFCCCVGDRCNENFYWLPPPATPRPSAATTPRPASGSSGSLAAIVAAGCLVALGACVCVGLIVYRMRKKAREGMANLDGGAGGANGPPSPRLLQKTVDFMELRAQGRFGRVWKAKLESDEIVAVKVFPLQERQSWFAEHEVYRLPRMSHENILRFIGIDRKGDGLEREFYLMTEFHSKGSLYDYLKHSTVSWPEVCKIAYSMSRGLAHLHEELSPKGTLDMKLAVAHRDFKSKNVLLKEDLTACIGDFGLAFIFEPGKRIDDTNLGQVGTRRYMAPEVLEGAITLSRDSLLHIDMYACGLVLWELASRCSMAGLEAEDYKLPFEEEIPHPTLEQMQDLVVNRRLRPAIPNSWTTLHVGLCELIATIRYCWDQDAEARISAANVTERMKALREIQQREEATTNEAQAEEGEEGEREEEEEGDGLTGEQRMNASNREEPAGQTRGRGNVGIPEERELTPLIINGHTHQQEHFADT